MNIKQSCCDEKLMRSGLEGSIGLGAGVNVGLGDHCGPLYTEQGKGEH